MQVLHQLPPVTDENVLVDTTTADDAGVYRIDERRALVQTIDFFTPIVDDPYAFGAIAAANALSDIYAMGGRPLFALSVVGFPVNQLPVEVLGAIMRGAIDKTHEAGIHIIGGHSIDDNEPKFGLVVTGIVDVGGIVRNVGAKPGDRLVLTKPIGVGIISTAVKAEKASPEVVERAVAVMSTLNRPGMEAMRAVGVNAATDITGFGLLGHLFEMISPDGLGARIDFAAVPIISEALEYARLSICPGGTKRNLAYLKGKVAWPEGLGEPERLVLADAQTSGGLLIAVAPHKTEALVEELRARDTLSCAVIGEVTPGDGQPIQVRA